MAYKAKLKQTGKCVQCQNDFAMKQTNHLLCSEVCRKLFYGRHSTTHIPTGSVGAISEMMLASKLLLDGYAVFRSMSPACFCDIVAVKGSETLFIEVRTAYKDGRGEITYPKKLSIREANPTHYGLYVPQDKSIHLIPIQATTLEKWAQATSYTHQ